MPSNTPTIPNRTVFIGDNLDVMRGLASDSVDLIYLDPPFNSNRNYGAPIGSAAAGANFKDIWTLNDVDLAWHGQIADQSPGLYDVIRCSQTTHGDGMMSYLIMMGVRLLEMNRLLKSSGSIYLHCDPTASHYLKLVMDSVFGKDKYKAEIVWRRSKSHNDSKNYGRITDTILFYSGANRINTDAIRTPLDPEYIKRTYRYSDAKGVFRLGDLKAPGGRGYEYVYHGHLGIWRYPEYRMAELEEQSLIHIKPGRVPCYKRYLHENKGKAVPNLWNDIGNINARAKEGVGYPTQKPLALLERIIKASSNYGDVVLDPFAGCATACVAAQRLGRKWIGIDLSPKAGDMIHHRLYKDLQLESTLAEVRTDLPTRTDLPSDPRPMDAIKEELFGKQRGFCNGCQRDFLYRNFEVDHIIPRAKAGSDHPSNLQLLCGACNKMKHTGTQAELIAKLKSAKLIAS